MRGGVRVAVLGLALLALGVAQAAPVQPAGSENAANDRLMKLPAKQQAATLGNYVGSGCVGATAFYMGEGTSSLSRKAMFWSVRCVNGKAYAVQIKSGPMNGTTVLECATLRTVAGAECFQKLK